MIRRTKYTDNYISENVQRYLNVSVFRTGRIKNSDNYNILEYFCKHLNGLQCLWMFINTFFLTFFILFIHFYSIYIFYIYFYSMTKRKIDLSCLNLKFIFSITEFKKDILIIYLKLSIEY